MSAWDGPDWRALKPASTEQGNVQPWRENVERVREALVGAYPEINSAFREVHVDGMQALDALTTKIEELEHDAIDVEADRRYQQDRARAAEQRAEELERERDEQVSITAGWQNRTLAAERERDELLGSVLAAIIELNSWLPSHSSEALRGTLAEAAAALDHSEDTSDES